MIKHFKQTARLSLALTEEDIKALKHTKEILDGFKTAMNEFDVDSLSVAGYSLSDYFTFNEIDSLECTVSDMIEFKSFFAEKKIEIDS